MMTAAAIKVCAHPAGALRILGVVVHAGVVGAAVCRCTDCGGHVRITREAAAGLPPCGLVVTLHEIARTDTPATLSGSLHDGGPLSDDIVPPDPAA